MTAIWVRMSVLVDVDLPEPEGEDDTGFDYFSVEIYNKVGEVEEQLIAAVEAVPVVHSAEVRDWEYA